MSKYIKLFQTHADYTAFTQTDDFLLPNVSYCEDQTDVVHYNPFVEESLASLAELGSPLNRVQWTPTSDELAYIQREYDKYINGQAPLQCDWSTRTLYVSGDGPNKEVEGYGYYITGGCNYYIAVDEDFKIKIFYIPVE